MAHGGIDVGLLVPATSPLSLLASGALCTPLRGTGAQVLICEVPRGHGSGATVSRRERC